MGTGHTTPFCTGSIIADSWVISARHCFDNFVGGNNFEVIAGSSDYRNGTRYRVAEWSRHDDILRDIAVIKIVGAFPSNLERVGLGTHDVMARSGATGQLASFAGWGQQGPDRRQLPQMHQARPLRLDTDLASCFDGHPLVNENIAGVSALVCAFPTQQSNVCFGDSGGPLTVEHQGRAHVIGISAGVHTDCMTWSAFTTVAHYSDWIRNNTRGEVFVPPNPPPPPP
ncbi:MAG: S1 family peptidase, partial [Acidimicrobiales bacterium]